MSSPVRGSASAWGTRTGCWLRGRGPGGGLLVTITGKVGAPFLETRSGDPTYAVRADVCLKQLPHEAALMSYRCRRGN